MNLKTVISDKPSRVILQESELAARSANSILEAAYSWERLCPNKVFLTGFGELGERRDFTWAETMAQARLMAGYLNSLKLPANSKVAIVSSNCPHFIISELAIWMAGHATVALFPTLKADSIAYIFQHSEARAVFLGPLEDTTELDQGIPKEILRISFPGTDHLKSVGWHELLEHASPVLSNIVHPLDRLALICYTSGSTGEPKGVMHSFASISSASRLLLNDVSADSSDRAFSYLPLAHVLERLAVECVSFYSGGQIFFARGLSTFTRDLRVASPTVFISVPRLWLKFQAGVFQSISERKLELLLKIPLVNRYIKTKLLTQLGLSKVRLAVSASAPLPAELIHWYDKLGLEICEGYAMSEDFSYSHLSTPERRRAGFVGFPASGVETRISSTGEVEIKSPGNMMGYYKSPKLTRESYTDDGYFKTGDLGEYSDDGLLRITGRAKELFKTSKGKYVAPSPIENIINADSIVELSCVSGSGQVACFAILQLTEELHAKLEQSSSRVELTPKLEQLIDRVNRQIEAFERLQFMVVVNDSWKISNGFLTPTLKIKRITVESYYEKHQVDWFGGNKKIVWHGFGEN